MKRRIMFVVLAMLTLGALVVPTVSAQETVTEPSRCAQAADRLTDHLNQLNEIKVTKIQRYDAVTDKIKAVAAKYNDPTMYSQAVVDAAILVEQDGDTLATMIHGDHSEMTNSISGHYDVITSAIVDAQEEAARCDDAGKFREAIAAVKTAWQAATDDKQVVIGFWNETVKDHLRDLREAVKNSQVTESE